MNVETKIVSSLEKVFCSPAFDGRSCKYLTALKGRDGMPGRQFGLPSLRNRVLGILLYVYDCAGFLQWGYNF